MVSTSRFGVVKSEVPVSNYLETVARFALHRLAGTRTITENALSGFHFAEEGTRNPAGYRFTSFDPPYGAHRLRCDGTGYRTGSTAADHGGR
jgi:hypothetical protein